MGGRRLSPWIARNSGAAGGLRVVNDALECRSELLQHGAGVRLAREGPGGELLPDRPGHRRLGGHPEQRTWGTAAARLLVIASSRGPLNARNCSWSHGATAQEEGPRGIDLLRALDDAEAVPVHVGHRLRGARGDRHHLGRGHDHVRHRAGRRRHRHRVRAKRAGPTFPTGEISGPRSLGPWPAPAKGWGVRGRRRWPPALAARARPTETRPAAPAGSSERERALRAGCQVREEGRGPCPSRGRGRAARPGDLRAVGARSRAPSPLPPRRVQGTAVGGGHGFARPSPRPARAGGPRRPRLLPGARLRRSRRRAAAWRTLQRVRRPSRWEMG